MNVYEDVLDQATMLASEIISREDHKNLVDDLYTVICEKCENGLQIDELNGIERIFYLVMTFQFVMNNAGIEQYYKDDSGNYANETVESLIEIQANDMALILDKGNSIFKNGIVPENIETRLDDMNEFDYRERTWLFDELDYEYCHCAECLDALVLDYILKNKEAFL